MAPDAAATKVAKDSYVLFLDNWGTASRSDDEFPCQAHFLEVLAALARKYPAVDVIHAGDVAYCYSTDLQTTLAFGAHAFKAMCLSNDSFLVRPIRSGIAKGTRTSTFSQDASITNLRTPGVLGRGNVEAARLEKSGQKGMRFFMTPEVAQDTSALKGPWLLRECATKGFDHYELNWMTRDTLNDTFLESAIDGRPLRVLLMDHARNLLETNDNYSQQLGSSLLDLAKWAAKN